MTQTPPDHTPDYNTAAKTIDHSLLRPELTLDDVAAGCAIAAEYDVASVCVRPADVALAVEHLRGTDVAIGTVVAFPHGANLSDTKVSETSALVALGATEIDMVINIGWLLSGRVEEVGAEIAAVVRAAEGHLVKVIMENAYLTEEQIVQACRVAEAAGAHYVKTSTGFAPSGATLDDVRLMRRTVSERVKVKCAGGVRTLDALLDMREAGASRSGATATAAILDEYRSRYERG
ncbi:MAG: deoxyribose-phosphate aldolase [Propionibacteriaceae bacterium]